MFHNPTNIETSGKKLFAEIELSCWMYLNFVSQVDLKP